MVKYLKERSVQFFLNSGVNLKKKNWIIVNLNLSKVYTAYTHVAPRRFRTSAVFDYENTKRQRLFVHAGRRTDVR